MSKPGAYLAQFKQPAQTFDGLAKDYDRHRPGYPAALLRTWLEHLDAGRIGKAGPRRVVDLGCGTGISTRALRETLNPVDLLIGAEPGADMRMAFHTHPVSAALPLVAAFGERLPFAGHALDGITIAQAIHWMDRPRLYGEARRVLAPGGTLAILTNDRRWPDSPFLGAYEDLLEALSPGYGRDYRAFDYPAELAGAGGRNVIVRTERWSNPTDGAGFLGLARSTSMVKKAIAAHGSERVLGEVEALIARHADARGRLAIPYATTLTAARFG